MIKTAMEGRGAKSMTSQSQGKVSTPIPLMIKLSVSETKSLFLRLPVLPAAQTLLLEPLFLVTAVLLAIPAQRLWFLSDVSFSVLFTWTEWPVLWNLSLIVFHICLSHNFYCIPRVLALLPYRGEELLTWSPHQYSVAVGMLGLQADSWVHIPTPQL